MAGPGFEPHGCAKEAGSTHDGDRDEEEHADHLLQPWSADYMGHVGDGVVARVVVVKVPLEDGAGGVEGVPAQYVDGAGEGPACSRLDARIQAKPTICKL